ncbi:aminoglycoside N(3)-acetyltransferase [Kitasatospora sp. KL5]|uniref:aminoglycoside N(3)-acetyltransferase n=1 Tax=Kitasatospora sp. KL5 TaxID=3425125 RepID=UPI003D6F631E
MYSQRELTGHLRALGVREGEVLLVQSSARAVGPVRDRTRTIVAALREALGEGGTLVAYTATPENSRTSPLHKAATAGLSGDELRRFVDGMKAFDREHTPASPTMGRVAEEIRLLRGAVRSNHPQTSFTAVGPMAEELTADHDLDCHLGERSPVNRLYKAGARVLLISVPWSCCTVFHLAEYRRPDPPLQHYATVVTGADGRRTWARFEAPRLETAHFEQMAAEIVDGIPGVERGPFGDAGCVLMPIAETVDVATEWLLKSQS